ncbi:MAG TPA: methyltransferase domain-containing protein [Vicinamibacterales bacterium]|nr:methyltransferase domain-containing protein [Vicinamibacterales bacterium]
MNTPRALRPTVFALCLSLLAGSAFAQSGTKPKPYEPVSGQEGKDVVWVPTPEVLVEKMLDMAKVTPQDVVMDLGSGDGRTVIAAAKRGATGIGVEYNPDMVELSRRKAAEAGVSKKATFVKADLFETDLSKATVITMFLLPRINVELRPKILDLKPGTRIVSNSFTMEDWEADETETIPENCVSWCTALLWIVPAKVAGTWTTPQGTLRFDQQFQMVTGEFNGKPLEGRLRGTELTFTSGGRKYTGRVNGNTIEGDGWTATKK